MKQYQNEKDGQIEFLTDYLKLVDKSLSLDEILSDNTDGIINGNLLEFKLVINNLNSVLFQSIKYLSALRIKGKSIPSNIILISLNTGIAYIYNSNDYLADIEKVYVGGSSKNNSGFTAKKPNQTLEYISNKTHENTIITLLKSNNFTKINIDENCIVGWATRYYNENPDATKADFLGDKEGKVNIIGEIRSPNKLKDFIFPYTGSTNVKFEYLMDKLNDNIKKKNLGAFYTPLSYVEKSYELLRKAIARVPKGNDYVIIDRCAGTGNLEKLLTTDELSHCIVSTVEYYEYKVLLELLGDKVRYVVPPVEKDDTFNAGLVRGSDALSKEFLEHEVIKQYIDDPKCTIILFENPPYAETTSIEHQKIAKAKSSSSWKNSYVVEQMKKEVKGSCINDLANIFIWSAFKYYLRQPTDSYIVFSPVKYWKAQHLIDKQFMDGFAFNRKHFHTNTEACIMCALWSNENTAISEFELKAYDINTSNNSLIDSGKLKVKRIYTKYSDVYYEKREFNDKKDGILVGLNGLEATENVKKRIAPIYNENIIGYLVADGAGFDNPDLHSSLLVAGRYNGNGFFVRDDNFLEKLPMFASSRYINYNRAWTQRAMVMKSADGSKKFFDDIKNNAIEQDLLKILLFTVLETQIHCRSFLGSTNRTYRNELTLDITNGDTKASKALEKLKVNDDERKLLDEWNNIIKLAKQTENYDGSLTYGIYQIQIELNTFYMDDKDNKIYNYPQLNGSLLTLKQLVKEYYLKEIVPFLFKYEFLK